MIRLLLLVNSMELDLPGMMGAKESSVKQLTGGIVHLFKQNGVGLISARLHYFKLITSHR